MHRCQISCKNPSFTLWEKAVGSSITLVLTYQTTRRHIPEDCYLDHFTNFIDQVGPSGRPYVAEMLVFWDVTPRGLVEADRCLRLTYCRHTESRIVRSQRSESLKPRISWGYRGFSLSMYKLEMQANKNQATTALFHILSNTSFTIINHWTI